jgi:hypothetical protein
MSTQNSQQTLYMLDMMLLKLLEQERYLFIKLVRTYSTQSMRQIYLVFLNQDLFIPFK